MHEWMCSQHFLCQEVQQYSELGLWLCIQRAIMSFLHPIGPYVNIKSPLLPGTGELKALNLFNSLKSLTGFTYTNNSLWEQTVTVYIRQADSNQSHTHVYGSDVFLMSGNVIICWKFCVVNLWCFSNSISRKQTVKQPCNVLHPRPYERWTHWTLFWQLSYPPPAPMSPLLTA